MGHDNSIKNLFKWSRNNEWHAHTERKKESSSTSSSPKVVCRSLVISMAQSQQHTLHFDTIHMISSLGALRCLQNFWIYINKPQHLHLCSQSIWNFRKLKWKFCAFSVYCVCVCVTLYEIDRDMYGKFNRGEKFSKIWLRLVKGIWITLW